MHFASRKDVLPFDVAKDVLPLMSIFPDSPVEATLDWSFIDSECIMKVDCENGTVLLKANSENMIIRKAGIFSDNGSYIGDKLPSPVICRSDDISWEQGVLALTVVTNSASYLFADFDGQWHNFCNQYSYAQKHNHGFILFLGEVNNSLLQFIHGDRSAFAAPCGESVGVGNHIVKVVAMALMLARFPFVNVLVFMDLDAWFPKSSFSMSITDVILSFEEDLVVGMPSYGVLADSAVMAFKNTNFSKRLLWSWFKHRCGYWDQTSLWNALFRVLNKYRPEFVWNESRMMTHTSAVRYNFDVVREFFPTLKKCWDKGSMVVCSETIRIPHVAILPNSGADAWRYQAPFVWNYWWGSPMICHCKPGKSCGIGCGASDKIVPLKQRCNER
jgi:hypothetical protein